MFTEVTNLESRSVTFDYTSSGMGNFDTFEVYANNFKLFSNVKLLEYKDLGFQTIPCAHCGFIGCEPGSWISLRKIADRIVITPAAQMMLNGEWERIEYQPPEYLISNGPISFSYEKYQELRILVSELPELKKVPVINPAEALTCHQLTIPGKVLGSIGSLGVLNADAIIAVSTGDLNKELDAFKHVLNEVNLNKNSAISCTPDRIVEFYFDLPNFPSWSGFGYKNGSPVLIC